jgi:hypothetical protein
VSVASVKSNTLATDTALVSATRITFVGSMMPAPLSSRCFERACQDAQAGALVAFAALGAACARPSLLLDLGARFLWRWSRRRCTRSVPPTFADQHTARFRAERNAHGVCQVGATAQHFLAGFGSEQKSLIGHDRILDRVGVARSVTCAPVLTHEQEACQLAVRSIHGTTCAYAVNA